MNQAHHPHQMPGMHMTHGHPYQNMMQNNGGMGFSPTVCPVIDLPVCGRNNQTYQNDCFMRQAGVGKAYDGWCIHSKGHGGDLVEAEEEEDTLDSETPGNGFDPDSNEDCPCDSTFNPVCAANGITFANVCRAKCRGLKGVHYGPCGYFNWQNKTGSAECECDLNFNPVCAKNQITFENACVLNCHKYKPKYNGICEKPCGCPFFYKPVCGSTGRSYINQCYLNCKKVAKISDGECSSDSMGKCQHCAGYRKPVCSTDQTNFDNECYLKCEKKSKLHDGTCIPRDKNGNCICKSIELPVCGENNETYQNECEMRCAGKKLLHTGKCGSLVKPPQQNGCSCSGFRPVCGSNGISYRSPCSARCKSVLKPITIVSEGECQPLAPPYCHCPTIKHLVCGVDGKNYLNICVLKCLGVNKAFDGKCQLDSGMGPDYIMTNIAQKPNGSGGMNGGGSSGGMNGTGFGNVTNNFWAQTYNQSKGGKKSFNNYIGSGTSSGGNVITNGGSGVRGHTPGQHWSVKMGKKKGYNLNIQQHIHNDVKSQMGMMKYKGSPQNVPAW
ncbi:MAG: hypothetical protein GY938_03015 [Ketobacter sp.]|nr:hypothetical protein [Ketobacter sp.]